MPTVKVTLYPEEREALIELAREKKRDPRAQAAMVIRDHLIKSGLLIDRGQSQRTAESGEGRNGNANG